MDETFEKTVWWLFSLEQRRLIISHSASSGLSVLDLPSLVTQLNEIFAPGISSKAETLTEVA